MDLYESHGNVKYVCDPPYRLHLVVELDDFLSLESEEYAATIVAQFKASSPLYPPLQKSVPRL